MQAAVYGPLLGRQHALHLLPHRQHQPADQVQRLDARARPRALLRRTLVRFCPCFARLRPVQPLVPAPSTSLGSSTSPLLARSITPALPRARGD